MTYGTRTDHYPATSKLLHWLVAACVLITAPVAIAMPRLSSGENKMFKDCADCPRDGRGTCRKLYDGLARR